ncbi:hypothetical protein AJ80_01296 [Polytolypa hystricis UAMH7299]|uniref:Uncharacterized protein n=1 Tax=Polytolypa hystricis (strain UAMH7299) TaxID=1447883 RepID=A0A2B7Z1J1_POLH7|nr:hypothetical protein AJ80_01296 [Polytolypa hystricis UAMH7299]
MIPPSDSIGHQSLKLAEFLNESQARDSRRCPPPPPYAPAAVVPSITTRPTHEALYEEDEDEDDDDSANMTPISIKIDTSINIVGQRNTIVIPSSVSAGLEESKSTSPSGPNSSSSPSPSSMDSASLQQLHQQRQAKSAQLTSSVIAALKASGVLADRETGRQRPIEVCINAGISIKGDGNVICAGAARRRMEFPPADSATKDVNNNRSKPLVRKRRANSQPIEVPSAKRVPN